MVKVKIRKVFLYSLHFMCHKKEKMILELPVSNLDYRHIK